MAQFDVFANPNEAQREGFPYLVVMQNDQLSGYSTRLVMPLSRLARPPVGLPRRLMQPVVVEGQTVYPAAHLCAPFPERLLRRRVASLRPESAALVDALDAVVGGV